MGNLVVSVPAIQALQEFYHDKTFCLVVDSAYSEIVENLSGVDQLMYYPRQQLRSSSIINQSVCFLKFIMAGPFVLSWIAHIVKLLKIFPE